MYAVGDIDSEEFKYLNVLSSYVSTFFYIFLQGCSIALGEF